MAIKKATYKVDNGSNYDEVMFKTTADQVKLNDGKNIQDFFSNGGEINGSLTLNGNHLNIKHAKTPDINIISSDNNKTLQLTMLSDDNGGHAEIRLKNGEIIDKSLKIGNNGFEFNSGISTKGDWAGLSMFRPDGKKWGMYVHETNPNMKLHTDINGSSREIMYIGTSSIGPIESMTLGEENGYKWKDIYLHSFSKSKNGYTKLPNGLILQWGEIIYSGKGCSDFSGLVTFPLSFPNKCLSVSSNVGAEGGYQMPAPFGYYVKNSTTTSFEHRGRLTDNNRMPENVMGAWFAIGY